MVTLGDQAHNNRAKGGSTGGVCTSAAGPEVLEGQAAQMSLLGWKSWKLKRKAVSTNDGGIQSIVEAEDLNYRCRLLWAELNGAGVCQGKLAYEQRAEQEVKMVKGLVLPAEFSCALGRARSLRRCSKLGVSSRSWGPGCRLRWRIMPQSKWRG